MQRFYISLLAGCALLSASAAHRAPGNVPAKRSARVAARVNVPAPQVLEATDVTASGFTANWQAVPGVDGYSVYCYEPVTISAAGTYAVIEENFNLVNVGTTVEPEFSDDFISLEDYGWVTSPDWQTYFGVFARGMVSGIVYSPSMDLTNNNGKYTITLEVVGEMGAEVILTTYGTTTDKRTLRLTQGGTNVFTETFSNGSHDTYFSFVDNGIVDDPEGLYTNKFDFLDDVVVTQELQAGDQALRLVAVGETNAAKYKFNELPFLYGAKRVCYDLYATVIEDENPDDPDDIFYYEMYFSDYSDMMYVDLKNPGTNPGTDPDDPNNPDDPDDPDKPELPTGNDLTFFVGNFENPTNADKEDGTVWDRAPFNWNYKNSGSQIIYTADMLSGLIAGDKITKLAFKYGDDGSFVEVESELSVFIQNSEATEFSQKEDSDKWMWIEYDPTSAHSSFADYEIELYYMMPEEIEFELTEPLIYDGKSLVVTTISNRTSDDDAMCAYTIAMHCSTKNSMPFGSDTKIFQDCYATGYNEPSMTPNKWVPVMAITFDRDPASAIESVAAAATEGPVRYYNLQGKLVNGDPTPGIYVRVCAAGAEKVVIR